MRTFLLTLLVAVLVFVAVGSSGAQDSQSRHGAALADRLGAVAATTQYRELGVDVQRRLSLTVADNLASLAIATPEHCTDPFIQRLRAKSGAREALVPGCGFALPAEEAAAAIAYLIHANETDDSDFRGELRASPPIFGAALAGAQVAQADGPVFLAALNAGFSTQGALAAPFGPLQPRYMSSGVWGPAGAAAAAARALSLSPQDAGAAIALASSAAAGPFQYFYDQTEEKRIIIARAARSGMEGALLARAGERGAAHVLEGRAGLFAAIDPARAAALDLDGVVATASRRDGPLYLYPKFFSASSSIIPYLEALDLIWRERKLAALDVESFTLAAEPGLARVLADKIVHFEAPTSEIGAKINFSFVVAVYMSRGSAMPRDFTTAAMSNPDILALARRARFEALPAGGGSRLKIALRSGETIAIEPFRIDPRTPTPDALAMRRRKFEQLTERLGPWQREALWRAGMDLSSTTSMVLWSRRIDALLR